MKSVLRARRWVRYNSILAGLGITASMTTLASTGSAQSYPYDCEIDQVSVTPGYLPGATAGDLVFIQTDNSSPIGQLMQTIQQPQSHVGVIVDDNGNVRDNYPDFNNLANGINMPSNNDPNAVAFDPNALAQMTIANVGLGMTTGLITEELVPGTSDKKWANRQVMLAHASDPNAGQAVAQAMNDLNMNYNLYAFSNMDAARAINTGDCSTTTLIALQNSGQNAGFSEQAYPRQMRAYVATQMFGFVDALVHGAVAPAVHNAIYSHFFSFLCGAPFVDCHEVQDDAIITGHLENQIMNTLLVGEYSNQFPTWNGIAPSTECYYDPANDPCYQNGNNGGSGGCDTSPNTCNTSPGESQADVVGDGLTVSPSDLYNQIMAGGTIYTTPVPTPTLSDTYTYTIVGYDNTCHTNSDGCVINSGGSGGQCGSQ